MATIAGGVCQYWQELADRGGVGRDPWPQVRALLRHRTSDRRALHLPLVVHDHPRIVLEVDELPVLPSEGLPLPDDHCWHHFLPQLRLALQRDYGELLLLLLIRAHLLDGGKDHVTAAAGWQSVQSASDPVHRDNVPRGDQLEYILSVWVQLE